MDEGHAAPWKKTGWKNMFLSWRPDYPGSVEMENDDVNFVKTASNLFEPFPNKINL